MRYLFDHTVFFDGDFRLITVILLVAAIATVAYCVIKASKLKKEMKELEKAVSEKESAENTSAGDT